MKTKQKRAILYALISFLVQGFEDLFSFGFKKNIEFKSNKHIDKNKNENNLQKGTLETNSLKERTLENRVVFWHNPTSEYRTGVIVKKFENGSVEIMQDSPYNTLIRKNRKYLVMDGKSGKVTIYN